MGSIPPAEAFEHPMRELVNVITDSFLVPTSGDLEQVAKGVRSQRMNYCEDTGSVNVLSVALDPPLINYTIGLPLRVKVRQTCTGPVTIDAGAGRVPVRKPNGSELGSGDVSAGGMAELVYDGTVFQMINFGGAGAGGAINVFQINIPYCVDSSPTPNTVIANFSPAITSYTAGLIIMVKIANTNTSFSNINVNGLGLKPIAAQGGTTSYPFLPGDIQAGDVIVLIYDGTTFWVYPNNAITQDVTFNVGTVAQINNLFSALGRKRITTSGSVTIQMAIGVYGPGSGFATITTYHPDASRITVLGTMKASQTPPTTANFQRSGSDPANLASDSAYNISMLRAKYGTEIRIVSQGYGITHVGPGAITYKNLLVTGSNTYASGPSGIGSEAGGNINCVNCSVWGAPDVGFDLNIGGYLDCTNCHACSCNRGYACSGNTEIDLVGGGSYGNYSHGVEAGYGATIGMDATDFASIELGPQISFNGGHGAHAISANVLAFHTTIVGNGGFDMFAESGGIVSQLGSSVGTTSPDIDNVGNLNAISVAY